MVYIISYDLKTPGRNYSSLTEAIKSYGVWWHQTGSVWVVVSDDSASAIRDSLMKHIDKNDKLFVASLKGSWAGVGFTEKVYNWIKGISPEHWK